jgi:hypothetical protein
MEGGSLLDMAVGGSLGSEFEETHGASGEAVGL